MKESAEDEDVKKISEAFRSEGASAVGITNDGNSKNDTRENRMDDHDDDDDDYDDNNANNDRYLLMRMAESGL